VSTDPHVGLTDEQVGDLVEWAREINAHAE
jgi:hypothetical protein